MWASSELVGGAATFVASSFSGQACGCYSAAETRLLFGNAAIQGEPDACGAHALMLVARCARFQRGCLCPGRQHDEWQLEHGDEHERGLRSWLQHGRGAVPCDERHEPANGAASFLALRRSVQSVGPTATRFCAACCHTSFTDVPLPLATVKCGIAFMEVM